MKRPAFQFYPADWRKDAALQSCSVAAQGLWINILCIAHECDPYGHLTVNGRPMTAAQIGRLVGLSPKECNALLAELQDAGVSSVAEDGAIFSRRMVRDEDVRNRRANGGKEGAEHGAKGAEHGAKGGRPKKDQGGKENPPSESGERGDTKPPLEPPPSSSSSSSTSVLPNGSTRAGEACKAIKSAGITAVNPSHPGLLALIAAGATPEEFRDVAAEGAPKGKGFPWVLATVEGRRRDAAARGKVPETAEAGDWTRYAQ